MGAPPRFATQATVGRPKPGQAPRLTSGVSGLLASSVGIAPLVPEEGQAKQGRALTAPCRGP